MDVYDDKKEQGLDEYKGESDRYISLSFNTIYRPPCKESNRLTDLGKGIRSLNHLIYIPKIGKSDNC